jgi:hypothetical protein
VHGDAPLVIAGSLGALWNLSLLPSNVEALLPAIGPATHALKKHTGSITVTDPGVTLLHHLAHRAPDTRVLEGVIGPVQVLSSSLFGWFGVVGVCACSRCMNVWICKALLDSALLVICWFVAQECLRLHIKETVVAQHALGFLWGMVRVAASAVVAVATVTTVATAAVFDADACFGSQSNQSLSK